MKEKHLTPLEAWDDFWKSYMENKPTQIPNDLGVANLTRNGRVKAQWGKDKDGVKKPGSENKKKQLGPLRIRRLLDKYAPGQYDFHEGSPYFTKPTKNKL